LKVEFLAFSEAKQKGRSNLAYFGGAAAKSSTHDEETNGKLDFWVNGR
jgi:hypothetical protein